MTRMKRERKEALLADLRSGKFEQAPGALERVFLDDDGSHRKSQFCCLGIQCKQAADEGIIHRVATDDFDGNYVARYGSNERSYLPKEVVEWAGWELENDYPDPEFAEYYLRHGLVENVSAKEVARMLQVDLERAEDHMILSGVTAARLNDSGVPFPKIADTIDEYVTAY